MSSADERDREAKNDYGVVVESQGQYSTTLMEEFTGRRDRVCGERITHTTTHILSKQMYIRNRPYSISSSCSYTYVDDTNWRDGTVICTPLFPNQQRLITSDSR